MSIKNFKSFKNYQKKALRPTTIEVLDKERSQMKFDKSKIKPALIKAIPALIGLVVGYIVLNLPGVIIGSIAGHQLSKLYKKFFGKKQKSFR